jgi:alpha-tubulin suppressor-like RCC1 family protein
MINAPLNLSAIAVSGSEVNLSWADNSNNEDGFEIWRSVDGITYTLLSTLNAGTISYSDFGLSSGTTYYYRVRAFMTTGDYSGYSNEVSVITSSIPPPELPSAWSAVAAGGYHTLALTTNGTVWAWGNNEGGQLGIGDTSYTNRTTPSFVGFDINGEWFDSINMMDGGDSHTVALKTNGTIWSWGSNGGGQLGLGDNSSSEIPIQIGLYSLDSDGFPVLFSADSDWAQITAGVFHSLGLKTNGTLWSWGWNNNGALGQGDGTSRNTPTLIGTQSDWVAVTAGGGRIGDLIPDHSLALKTVGTLWGWGANWYGQLGDGTTDNRFMPSQIGTQSDWFVVAAGTVHTIALKTNRTIWGWGANWYGQLGLGDGSSRNTPSQIGTQSDWSVIATGDSHTIALKTNRTIWGWGTNGVGQLGRIGDNTIPGQIGSDSDWSLSAAGYDHTIGIKLNQTLWIWGQNNYGQLGLGDTINRYIPCRLSSPTPPLNLTVSLVSSTQSTIFWVDNSNNEDGFEIERKTGAGGTYSQIDTVISGVTSYSDNTQFVSDITYYYRVRAYNNFGNSPYSNQDWMSLTGNWSLVFVGDYHTIAIKTNKTLWSWGLNNYGQLGLGDSIAQQNMPRQIGTQSDWSIISAGNAHNIALKINRTPGVGGLIIMVN